MFVGSILACVIVSFVAFVKAESYNQEALEESLSTAQNNGLALGEVKLAKNQIVDLDVDAGWFKFFFAGRGDKVGYTFRAMSEGYTQISITDAYCTGDSWDMQKNGSYLLTTPRVPSDNCKTWTDNPDVAFSNPKWSSTKFMLPGAFNITLIPIDSPYKGGAAFIRADSHVGICHSAVAPFTLVMTPNSQDQMAKVCQRVGGVPANITIANVGAAEKTLADCGIQHAWFGHLSLKQRMERKSRDFGCLAYSLEVPDDPTVDIVDCKSKLPTLCTIA